MSSTNSTAAYDFTNFYVFIGCGSAAILSNFVVLCVLIRNKQLLKKSAFVVGLLFGDMVNGIALFITGIVRINYVKKGVDKSNVRPFDCLTGFTTLWLIGIQIPTVMIFVIGCERTVAISFFTWYYKKWSAKLEWILTGGVYIYIIFSIAAIWVINYTLPVDVTTSVMCYTPSVTGVGYGTYNYGMAIFCGFSAIVASVFSSIRFLSKKKAQSNATVNATLHGFVKKQWRITLAMTCISAFDFVLVVIPNVILLMSAYKFTFPPQLSGIGFWSADLVCSRSALSLFIYICFNRDFRSALFNLLNVNADGSQAQSVVIHLNDRHHSNSVAVTPISLHPPCSF